MFHYAEIGAGDRVIQQHNEEMEVDPVPENWRLLATPINWAPPFVAAELTWPNAEPGPVWSDPRTTNEVRALATERVNRERDRRIAGFDRFIFNGALYDGDAAAKENILDAADSASDDEPLPENFRWRTFYNDYVLMTNADILNLKKAFRSAFNLHKQAMYETSWRLKDYAAGDLTNAELDAITWPE